MLDTLTSSNSAEWYTPGPVFDLVVATLGEVDLDPCWHPGSPVRARVTYTVENDGLVQPWSGKTYLNPPYGRGIGTWVVKLVDAYEAGDVGEGIALVPARTDTKWFRLLDAFPRCFVGGRLAFSNHENSAPFPAAIFYLGPNVERLAEVFGKLGEIWTRRVSGSNHRPQGVIGPPPKTSYVRTHPDPSFRQILHVLVHEAGGNKKTYLLDPALRNDPDLEGLTKIVEAVPYITHHRPPKMGL
jgi:DNA N-6-adenine-methyltransferase (Dam)